MKIFVVCLFLALASEAHATSGCLKYTAEATALTPSTGGHTEAAAANGYGSNGYGARFSIANNCTTGDLVDGAVIDAISRCWADSTSGFRYIEKRVILKRVSGHFAVISDRGEGSFGTPSMSDADTSFSEVYADGDYYVALVLKGPASTAADWYCRISGTTILPPN